MSGMKGLKEEARGLGFDAGLGVHGMDQATLFRAVDEGKMDTVAALLRNRHVDINAYNDEVIRIKIIRSCPVPFELLMQGVTAIFLVVYRYEQFRSVEMAELLIRSGAKVSIQAAAPPSALKISIVRHDQKHPHGERLIGTKKISMDHKTPLLVALELKSSLYVRGWEYRHWDALIQALAVATEEDTPPIPDLRLPQAEVPLVVQQGWAAAFGEGGAEGPEMVEVWAEGRYLTVLKAILVNSSKTLALNVESATAFSAQRMELKEASFPVVRAMVEFLYTGNTDPEFMQARGVDLYKAAHTVRGGGWQGLLCQCGHDWQGGGGVQYGVQPLRLLCESLLVPTPDTWIKLLAAAVDTGSASLQLKCARSIHTTLFSKEAHHSPTPHVFSAILYPDGGPISQPFV